MNNEHHKPDEAAKIDPEDRELRENNKAALSVHFLLSLAGVALFALVWIAMMAVPSFNPTNAETPVGLIDLVPWLVAIPVMSLIYIYCGYIYLTPLKKKAWRSVSWLAYVTLGHAILFVVTQPFTIYLDNVGGSVLGVMASLPGMIAILLLTASPLINSMWLAFSSGAVYAFDSLADLTVAFYVLTALASIVGALLPPGLLYLGMRLKQRYPNLANASKTRAATVEEGDHS